MDKLPKAAGLIRFWGTLRRVGFVPTKPANLNKGAEFKNQEVWCSRASYFAAIFWSEG